GHLKRREVPADLREHGERLAELSVCQEGVEQSDMGHPAVHVSIMLTPDGLYGLPDLRGWQGHHRRVIRLRWHTQCLRGYWAEGKEGGRLSFWACNLSVTSWVKKANSSR